MENFQTFDVQYFVKCKECNVLVGGGAVKETGQRSFLLVIGSSYWLARCAQCTVPRRSWPLQLLRFPFGLKQWLHWWNNGQLKCCLRGSLWQSCSLKFGALVKVHQSKLWNQSGICFALQIPLVLALGKGCGGQVKYPLLGKQL